MKVSGKDAALRERLTSYFQRYKLQKLRNRIDPDFLAWMEGVAGERPYNKLPTRSALVAQIPKQDTRLFFFDALGVEYLAYIQAKRDEYGLTAEISVGHCEVPLITVNNKEFVDALPEPPYDIKELDELKHHSRVIDYQKRKEPVHLSREREIIDRHLQSIRTGLQRETFRRAAVVAGHGASRLAVIYERESAAPIQLDEKAEHSGRCCPAETDPRIPFAAWENGLVAVSIIAYLLIAHSLRRVGERLRRGRANRIAARRRHPRHRSRKAHRHGVAETAIPTRAPRGTSGATASNPP